MVKLNAHQLAGWLRLDLLPANTSFLYSRVSTSLSDVLLIFFFLAFPPCGTKLKQELGL